jgi:hypothetical protein
VYVGSRNLDLHVYNTSLSGCSAGFNGGAFYSYEDNLNTRIERCTITDAHAGTDGGGIYLLYNGDNFSILDSMAAGCEAGSKGGFMAVVGGLYQGNDNVVIRGVMVSSSNALGLGYYDGGGGLYVDEYNDFFELTGSSFQSCHAAAYGGGVLVNYKNDDVNISGTSFTECTAGSGGGILFNSNINAAVFNVTFDRCVSVFSGGGLHIGNNE